jgi:hypothetical protein
MHISMVFASVLIDSVWTDRICLCYASALTAVEGALFALGSYYLEADFWNQHGTLLLCLMGSTLFIKTASQLLCAALTTTSHKAVKGEADKDEAGLATAVLGLVNVI